MKDQSLQNRESGEVFVSVLSYRLQAFIREAIDIHFVHLIGIIFVMYAGNSYFGLPMFDSQPFPIFVAIAFIGSRLIFNGGELKTPLLFLLVGIFSAMGIFMGTFFEFGFNMLFIRGVANYMSIFIYMIAFYEYIKAYGFPLKVLVFVNLLWLLVAILQLIEPGVVSSFVAGRTTDGRGVTSMSPEPSTFGYYLFFISWIYLMATNYNPPLWLKVLIGVNVFSIFFLAISALTIAMMIVSFLVFMIINVKMFLNIKNAIFLLIGISIFSFVIFYLLEGSRMEVLFDRLLNLEFETIMVTDRSVNSRVAHQILPLTLFFQNLGLPAGLQYFVTNIGSLDPYITEILWGNIDMDKIMSWNAAVIYELGLFGIMIWIFLFVLLLDGSIRRVSELVTLFIVLFTSVPLSYPLIPLIFTIMYMTNKHFSHRKKRLNELVDQSVGSPTSEGLSPG